MERSLQRNSIGNNPTPRLKVVGFHVEGASSSPAPASHLLQDMQGGSSVSDTPNPVIIPPSFQARPLPLCCCTQAARAGAHRASSSEVSLRFSVYITKSMSTLRFAWFTYGNIVLTDKSG